MLKIDGRKTAQYTRSIQPIQPYAKVGTIAAIQMDEPFEVETEEGTMRGNVGDWLAVGPLGEAWPIGDEFFQRMYERVDRFAT